jgi:hypothetical protein
MVPFKVVLKSFLYTVFVVSPLQSNRFVVCNCCGCSGTENMILILLCCSDLQEGTTWAVTAMKLKVSKASHCTAVKFW